MASRSRRPTADDSGTGLIGTLFGVTVFLLFMLLAVQVLVGLYTTTLVTSAALDAAHELAHRSDPNDASVQQAIQTRAVDGLGTFGRRPGQVAFDWSGTDGDNVVLTVHARKMTFLPPAFGAALGNRIDRTVRVRVERLR